PAFFPHGSVAPENPGQKLPVATRPAVLPGGRNLIVRGKVFKQLDVRSQRGSSKGAFKEVMAQHRVGRHVARKGGLKSIDIVDAFAGVRAFLEQILVDIRNRRRIWIDTARAGEDFLK